MSFDKPGKNTGTRRKAREAALQMMFSADVIHSDSETLTSDYWRELGDAEADIKARDFANNLISGAPCEQRSH